MPLSADEDRAARRYPLYLLLLGVLLYLPRLGAYGFWDPTEVRVADVARALVTNTTPPGNPHPTITHHLVARGFAALGVGELGGRLPLALTSIALLLAMYYAARSVVRPRAALVAAIALATMPTVLFGARQLTTQAPALLGVTLALGGLVYALWPPPGASIFTQAVGALAALAGLALGTYAGGVMVGAIAPLLAVAIALATSPQGRARALLPALGAVVLAIFAYASYRHLGAYSALLGGIPRPPASATVVTSILRPLGFATLPWIALVPFALYRALDGREPSREDDDEARARFARALAPAWLATTYLFATLHHAVLGDLLVPLAPAVALLAGAYLEGALFAPEGREIEALSLAALCAVLGHDVLLTTEALVSVNTSETVRWPVQLYPQAQLLFGLIAAVGLLLGAGLATQGVLAALQSIARGLGWKPAVALADRIESLDAASRERVQRRVLVAAVALQLAITFLVAQRMIPAASTHLSPKDLYGKTKQLDPNAPLGQYRFNATGASYYMGGRTATALNTHADVIAFLRRPERVFIFVGSEELAGIDQAVRQPAPAAPAGDGAEAPKVAAAPYYVIDDSSSRFLILSNRLGPNEGDLNPLRRFVSETAPAPKVPMKVLFEDKLELVGYDLPAEAQRGEDVRVRLYFKVLASVGGSYKIFLHFDGPGARVNGDHVPLDGRFATQFWTPGTYVTDEYLLKPDKSTQPSGMYQLYFGLFQGDRRMKVTSGPSDGDNRIRLGSVRVR